MKLLFITLITISLNAIAALPAATTKFYYGEIAISSVDGKIPYGKTVSLIKRTIEPAKNTITEIVLQPSRDPGKAAQDIRTVLTRIENSNVFSAVDDGKTFSGTLSFEGSEWAWNQWTYNIKLKDGSSLEGKGTLDEQGIKTRKVFHGVKSDSLLIEDVRSIDETEYTDRHAQMTAVPKSNP